ncbi:MAG: hypothetical protein FJ253_12735, partial [Phycisphaerae bacterium]|nr:hypothetical protein [Phycisphaerae bacterium]
MATEEIATRPEGPVIRRSELRRRLRPERSWHRNPTTLQSAAIALVFAVLTWVVCDWSRQQSRWVEGQVLTGPMLNRVDYQLENETLTRQQRELAKRNAPRIYEVDRSYLTALRAAIEGLPQAVAGKSTLEEVDAGLVTTFALQSKWLPTLQAFQDEKGPTEAWKSSTNRFIAALSSRAPIITRDEFQKFATAADREVVIGDSWGSEPSSPAPSSPQAPQSQAPPQAPAPPSPSNAEPPAGAAQAPASAYAPSSPAPALPPQAPATQPQMTRQIGRAAIELPEGDPSSLRTRLVTEAIDAGFSAECAAIVVNAILTNPQPTIRCDEAATLARSEAAAGAVRSVLESHPRGEVIAMTGDSLTRERLGRLEEEQVQASARTPALDRWIASLGLLGLCTLLAASICLG